MAWCHDIACPVVPRVEEEQKVPRVVVDLVGLQFADSTLLAVLVSVWKRITSRGGKMVLARVPPDIADVLRYTKLDTLWIAHATREAAVGKA